MAKLRNGSKLDSNPGSLDCESSILPLSYHAPHTSNLCDGYSIPLSGIFLKEGSGLSLCMVRLLFGLW